VRDRAVGCGGDVDGVWQACNYDYMSTQQEGAGKGRGHGAGQAEDEPGAAAQVRGWFAGRLPSDWFTEAPTIQVDREEITVVGALPAPALSNESNESSGESSNKDKTKDETKGDTKAETDAADNSDAARAAAAEGRIRRFREETRTRRVEIAREAEHRFRRKVSWGVSCAGETEMFTTLSVPVMTRLRQPERRVLDTLVDAGVARSRSDALAWCVRLTGENADAWLSRLREALRQVEEVRAQGPQ
jgi:hypothetical protein